MTINDLLANPLIAKYFGCDHFDGNCVMTICLHERAYRVLSAMCEPIKQGEKYIYSIEPDKQRISDGAISFGHFHPLELRLPDQFQEKKGCQHERIECMNCAKPFETPEPMTVATDPVEEKIRSVLRELVGLPREKK